MPGQSPMDVIRSDSLNCSKRHLPLAIHLLPLPHRRSTASVLLMHLPKSQTSSILTDTETPGSCNTTSKQQRCKLTKFCAILQWLWPVCLRVSPAAAAALHSVPSGKMLPSLQKAGTQTQRVESTDGGQRNRASSLLGVQMLDSNHSTAQRSNQVFNYFNRGQHLRIKNNHHQGISVILIHFSYIKYPPMSEWSRMVNGT